MLLYIGYRQLLKHLKTIKPITWFLCLMVIYWTVWRLHRLHITNDSNTSLKQKCTACTTCSSHTHTHLQASAYDVPQILELTFFPVNSYNLRCHRPGVSSPQSHFNHVFTSFHLKVNSHTRYHHFQNLSTASLSLLIICLRIVVRGCS